MNDHPRTDGLPSPEENAADRPATRRGFRRRFLLGLSVFLFAWWWASSGIEWSLGFHPDELVIARWINQVKDQGFVGERVYPGGWFELIRIKLRIDATASRIRAARERRRAQDGAVNATDPATFRRTPPPDNRFRRHIQYGRDFNSLLYALTALLLCLAALEAGLGTAGSDVSATFFLSLSPPLEHAHYCETDLGVLVSLALSFWAMAAAARRRSLPLALASGFASGFCVACKYTVAPLALVPPILAAFLGARGRRPGRAIAWAALALVATLLGFVAGTPILYRAPELVRAALAGGRKHDAEVGSSLAKLGSLCRETLRIGVLPALWCAVSVPFWARRPWRRALAGPALFSMLFVAGVFAILPWFRNQETLPLLAALSLGAGLPVATVLRSDPSARRRRALPLAAGAALLVAALVSGFVSSMRILDAFGRREMRAECREFLAEGFPREGRAAAEAYVIRSSSDVPGHFFVRDHIPEYYPKSLSNRKVAKAAPRYLVYDASHEKRAGRRREAFSGRPVESVRQSLEAFRRDAVLLRAWRLPDGSRRPIFAQHDAELWLLPREPGRPVSGGPDVPIPFERPLIAIPARAPLQDASGPAWFGPLEAQRTVGRRSEIHVPRDGVPRWAVTRHVAPEGTPVRLEWRGSFRPLSREPLAAGGTAVAAAPAATPGAWPPGIFRISRLRYRGPHGTNACLTFVTSDPAEAADSLRRAGRPADGLSLLRAAPGALEGSGTGPVEALLCAAAAGETPDPAWRKSAEAALAAFDALRGAIAAAAETNGPPPDASVCGVPFEALRDFSRLRIGRTMAWPLLPTDLFLPAGEYRIEVSFPPSRAPEVVGQTLFDGQSEPFAAVPAPTESPRAAATLRLSSDGFLCFRPEIPERPPDDLLFLREIEASWDPLAPVAATAETLRAALRPPAVAPVR